MGKEIKASLYKEFSFLFSIFLIFIINLLLNSNQDKV